MQNRKQRQAVIKICFSIFAAGLTAIGLFVQCGQSVSVGTELELENRTRSPLYFVYVAAVGRDFWSPDLLRGDVLLPDEAITVQLSEVRGYRVRAVDSHGRELDGGMLKPARTHTVVFSEDSLVVPDQPGRGLGWFTVHNYTSVPLQYFYISPVYADHWTDGEQLLDSGEVLLPNETVSLYIDTEAFQTTLFDMLAEDVAGNRYVHWDVNVQLNPGIEFRIQDIR